MTKTKTLPQIDHEPKDHSAQIGEARALLAKSHAALSRVAETCCMPERGPTINASLALIAKTEEALEPATCTEASVHTAVQAIGDIGENVGRLYATCCTPKRAPHYHAFFEGIGAAHGKLGEALGYGH